MIMSLDAFFHEYCSKNKASSIKSQNNLFSLPLGDVRVYLGDGPLKNGNGLVFLHPFESSYWLYIFTNAILIYMVLHHLTI